MIRSTRKQIIDLFRNKDNFLLLGHLSADGDSLGSMIALGHFLNKQLGKKVYIPYPETFPPRYEFLESDRAEFDSSEFPDDLTTIVLDCSSLNRLDAGKLSGHLKVDAVIDHHEGEADFDVLSWRDPSYPAVGIMIYELLTEMSAEFTTPISRALYTSILTDTGQFAFAGTTSQSLEIAGFLVNQGAEPAEIARQLYWEFPIDYMINMKLALNSLELHDNGRISFMVLRKCDMENQGQMKQTESIINLGIMINGVEITALFREINDDYTRVSFRSREGFDVSYLAKKFGGGGRYNASGCNIHTSLQKTKDIILSEVRKILQNS